jgi:tRNA uridine 5-carboxymethylaminomethyl modification enzyme
MWNYPEIFDVIVVGAGHAGCEAAYISSKRGAKTLLLSMNLDSCAKLSCNPSIGGTAKGHIVREIDALGGIMGKIADRTAIHYRMLNASKGPAVQSPRAQVDRFAYQFEMKKELEKVKNLQIKQGTVEAIEVENGRVKRVSTIEGVTYEATSIIICSGTFMKGKIFIGESSFTGGRNGELASNNLSTSLKELGFEIGRLKTGTPPRIHRRSIDFSKMEPQPSDEKVRFSFEEEQGQLEKRLCYITYTTQDTKEIIQKNIKKSALYSGKIAGIGPRYCPSIEDKIMRFSDKERHQVFLEPEGTNTDEFYVNGMSSSMSFDVQVGYIQTIIGLEKAEIMRPAYAIEYDYVKSGQINSTLETKKIKNLFLAGQINGTTGYEEAAAQGLIAGINGANNALGFSPFTLGRSESYISVLIDDLITKELTEPYRMFTSRAEHRLLLRQDNADLRLFSYAYDQQLISKERYEQLKEKKMTIEKEIERLTKIFKIKETKKISLRQLVARPESTYAKLLAEFPMDLFDFGSDINKQIETEIKYQGYISRQEKEIAKFKNLEKIKIPNTLPFDKIIGLRNEAKEKLKKFLPENLSIASRISGISPADISILIVAIGKKEFSIF